MKDQTITVTWDDLPRVFQAEYLLAHPTVADAAWTDEQRMAGETRQEFIRRQYEDVLAAGQAELAGA